MPRGDEEDVGMHAVSIGSQGSQSEGQRSLSGEALARIDEAGQIVATNTAFARTFRLEPATSTTSGGGCGRAAGPLSRFVPMLTATRLARWASENPSPDAGTPRAERLLAEGRDATGERFLAAVTLMQVPSPADARPAARCLVAVHRLDDAQTAVDRVGKAPGIATLVARVLEGMNSSADRQRCVVTHQSPGARADAAPEAVCDALRRILDNACRYSAHETPVQIRSRLESTEPADPSHGSVPREHLVITVADRGCGLTRGQQQQAFEPFWRALGPSGGSASLGLGLTVARHRILAQGGWIELRSVWGFGTEIDVWLRTIPAGR